MKVYSKSLEKKSLILDLWGPLKCGGPGHVPAVPAPKSGPARRCQLLEAKIQETPRLLIDLLRMIYFLLDA